MRSAGTTPNLSIKKSPPVSLRVGELLVKEGFVQPADLNDALKAQRNGPRDAQMPIGTLMVQKNLINAQQLQILLDHPDLRKHLGNLLVGNKMITHRELENALELKKSNEHLGQILVRKGEA